MTFGHGPRMTFGHGPRGSGAANSFLRAPRRVLYAFGLGLALSVAGLTALAAGARGNFVLLNINGAANTTQPAERFEREQISIVRYGGYATQDRDDEDGRAHLRRLSGAAIRVGGAQPVCVRLCDGYFFPLPTPASDVASQGAACDSLCPDAPTEVYYRSNPDKIEDSVSVSGKLYSALPVSLRYRATSDHTCSCHRDAVAYSPLRDATLKRGDAIMTPAGFMVFRGVEGAPHGSRDFAALSGADLESNARGALLAMERASLGPVHPSLKDWLLSQNAPAGLGRQAEAQSPTQVALRGPTSWRMPASAVSGKIRLMTWRARDE